LLLISWAVTSSVLAFELKEQKDEADRQTAIAKTNEDEALRQTGIAQKNEKEAIWQTGIAEKNAEEAKKQSILAEKQTAIAHNNAESAKATAKAAVAEMVRLGETMYQRLQSKRVSAKAEPEIRLLREEMLTPLRKAMKALSSKIESAGATNYGQAAMCQALGDLFVRLGMSEDAAEMYKQGHGIVERIAAEQPNSDLARGNLGVLVLRLGNVPFDLQGDARTALKYYLQAYQLHQEILTKPRDGFYKEIDSKRIVSHDAHHVGEALLALGDPQQARKFFEESLTYRQAWSKAEPKSLEARSYILLGGRPGHAGTFQDGNRARCGLDRQGT
jgi:tetratricopeptide (TPR) repeat protein